MKGYFAKVIEKIDLMKCHYLMTMQVKGRKTMELTRIEIKNFRSIASINIYPSPTCQGFVGINESGKSNILNAISMISPDVNLDKNDVRIEGKDEERNQDSYVKYHFSLMEEEIKDIVSALNEKIFRENNPLFCVISEENEFESIDAFFLSKKMGEFFCDVKEETKKARYYRLDSNENRTLKSIKKKKSVAKITSLITPSGDTVDLSKYNFIETACIAETDIDSFEDCTLGDLNVVFGSILTAFINDHLPDVIFWKYDDKYLLPNSVSLENFYKDPTSCIPLKSMFDLAGYQDIKDIIPDALTKRGNYLINILNNVSKKSTEYLRKVWRDYKNVKFELRRNGANIDIHIQDSESFFDCDQRSDGFKRFITFLLALSARVNNGEIENCIIIIDEPDIGIHILGQKNLLKELIKISKNNMVLYSTHSIFMIDRKKPSRHFIVRKKGEITSIEQASESTYTDDEVLFNALGYSIFEALKKKNIIFEGWSDENVYELAITKQKEKNISDFRDIGKVHATGVKNIVNIAKIMELVNREYCVVSDSDKPAMEKKKNYEENEACSGVWYTYKDFVDNVYTLEDFIRHTAFKKSIENARENHKELDAFDYSSFQAQFSKRESFIKSWVNKHISDKDTIQKIMSGIKSDLYSNLKTADIEDTYFEFLASLADKFCQHKVC